MPSDRDYMMTAEEIRVRNQRRRRILIALVVLVALLVAGIFGGKPTLHAIRAWQARRHAAKAFANIEKENWVDARKEAMAAYQLRQTEPESIRAVARFLSRTRQPEALEFWQQLEKIEPLEHDDLLDEAAISIALGENARAETALNALRASNEMDAAAWLLAAQLSIQNGAADDAMSALRKIFDDSKATEPQQLQAALLEISLATGTAGPDERQNDGWSRIEKIARGTRVAARDALVLLARRNLSQKSQVTDQRSEKPITDNQQPITADTNLAQRLADHPLSKVPQKLLALDLLEHHDASRRDELIAKGIEQFKNGDASDLQTLATWLNGKAEFQKTLDNIPLAKALQSKDLFLQYLDALGGLEHWTEVKQLLESDRYPFDPVIQKMYLARCNAQLGEKTAAENNWQRALEAATGDAGKLLMLGDYAEKNGVLDVAKSAFDGAVQLAPKFRLAQQGRLRMAQRTGDTKKIHDVLADMLKIWPKDAAVQNDEGYTRLLLAEPLRVIGVESGRTSPLAAGVSPANQNQTAGTAASTEEKELSTLNSQRSTNDELDSLADVAHKLVEKNPRSLPHRTFLALARLKQNRPADALAVYDKVTVAPNALTPSALAIHAIVLAANNRADEAQSEARQVKLDQLLPEERTLIDGLPYD